ncbi:hypothetical protein ACFB49_44880 [Sphingomonas sp. DBB INV C78]
MLAGCHAISTLGAFHIFVDRARLQIEQLADHGVAFSRSPQDQAFALAVGQRGVENLGAFQLATQAPRSLKGEAGEGLEHADLFAREMLAVGHGEVSRTKMVARQMVRHDEAVRQAETRDFLGAAAMFGPFGDDRGDIVPQEASRAALACLQDRIVAPISAFAI